jgi:hypothetical protein
MTSTARQLRQPPTIEAIDRGQYFADAEDKYISLVELFSFYTYLTSLENAR